MPPHCDTMDGPVVTAARRALDSGNLGLALAYIPRSGEAEVSAAFQKVMAARAAGPEAREVADLYFFETLVRVHRAGEGAAYTGLDEGPVIPAAEQAIESRSPEALLRVLSDMLPDQVTRRFGLVEETRDSVPDDVAGSRAHVEASLGLMVWSHKLYLQMLADAHEGHGGHHHG